MPGHRNRQDISVGARYSHRDAPNVVWEVVALYVGVDGLRHAVLSNLADPTWRKTMSNWIHRNRAPGEAVNYVV